MSIFDDFNELINDESVLEEVKNIPCGLTYDSDPNGKVKDLFKELFGKF